MKPNSKRVVSALLTCAALMLAGPIGSGQQQTAIPVIVVFDDQVSFEMFDTEYQPDQRAQENPNAWRYLARGVAGATQLLERRHGFRAVHVFSAAIRGFSARLTPQQIADLQADPTVSYIERDGVMRIVQQTLPWGVDKADADLSSTVAGDGGGAVSNVSVYIIDTGLDVSHGDLFVVEHVTFTPVPLNRDCNGHGTHVGGTTAAGDNDQDVVGVAPGAPLTGVKVLSCNGAGSTSDVIKGVDWVTANAVRPAVANMSLAGAASVALDSAVLESAASGVLYALAAGNSGADACTFSPVRTGAGMDNGIVTTAATDVDDQEPAFSNFGSCVDLWAPGVAILSTRRGGGTRTFSGTSMASPHVAGGGALFLSQNPTATPSDVEAALKAFAQSPGTASKDGRPIRRLWVGAF